MRCGQAWGFLLNFVRSILVIIEPLNMENNLFVFTARQGAVTSLRSHLMNSYLGTADGAAVTCGSDDEDDDVDDDNDAAGSNFQVPANTLDNV